MSSLDETILENSEVESVEIKHCFFIDQYEIEEMLGEYYDFSSLTFEQWMELDEIIRKLCKERGINPFCIDEYTTICDVCCERLKIPSGNT